MSELDKFKTEALGAISILAILTMCGFVIWESCKVSRPAAQTIGVHAQDFEEATESAMELINSWVGCDLLVPGEDVLIMSTNGEPCGVIFHEDNRTGQHSAEAYQCQGRFEIHVSRPGNIHTQACIVAHELGHVLGLEDGWTGIMNQHSCPEKIRVSDKERAFLRRAFCE